MKKFIKEFWHFNFYMNIGNSNWHNSSFDSTKMKFFTFFIYLHDYWPPITLISLVQNSLGEMERCEKRGFQLLKMRKMKVSRNIKIKCVTDILLTFMSSSMKDNTWVLCFSWFSFSHFEKLKSTFFTSFHFAPRGMY